MVILEPDGTLIQDGFRAPETLELFADLLSHHGERSASGVRCTWATAGLGVLALALEPEADLISLRFVALTPGGS